MRINIALPELGDALAFLALSAQGELLSPVEPFGSPLDLGQAVRFPFEAGQELALLAIQRERIVDKDWSIDLGRLGESRLRPEPSSCPAGLETPTGDRLAWSVDPSVKLWIARGASFEPSSDPIDRARYQVAIDVPLGFERCRRAEHLRPFGPPEGLIPETLEVCGQTLGTNDAYMRDLHSGVRLDTDRLFAVSRGAMFYFDRARAFVPSILCASSTTAGRGVFGFQRVVPIPGQPAKLLVLGFDEQSGRSVILEVRIDPSAAPAVQALTVLQGVMYEIAIDPSGRVTAVGLDGLVNTATSVAGPYHRLQLGVSELKSVATSSTQVIVSAADGHVYFGSSLSEPGAYDQDILSAAKPLGDVLIAGPDLWVDAGGEPFRKQPAGPWEKLPFAVPHRGAACADLEDGCGRLTNPGKVRGLSWIGGRVLYTSGGCLGALAYDPSSGCVSVIEPAGGVAGRPSLGYQPKAAARGGGPFTLLQEMGHALELSSD